MQHHNRQKIMLVDDNKANLTMGKHILGEYYEVYALPSADKLFEFIKHVKPDLIILDIEQVFGLQSALISTVADLVEFRDNPTGWHVSRTQKYLKALIEQLSTDGIYLEELLSWDTDAILPSARLHDVGKISISDTILNKPGKLTPAEFEIMKTHTAKGVEAIAKMARFGYFADFLEYAKVIAGTHHEKWDGSGYPQGLKGQKIPLAGRIMAIADVYDALISPRPYKKALSTDEAARIIIEGSGTHFDPAIIDVFKKLTGEFATIATNHSNI